MNVVAAAISLMVISLKLMVSYSSAQAAMISSFRAAVSAGEPLDIGYSSFESRNLFVRLCFFNADIDKSTLLRRMNSFCSSDKRER